MKRLYLLLFIVFIGIFQAMKAGSYLKRGDVSGNNTISTVVAYKSTLVDESLVNLVYAQQKNNLEIEISPEPIRKGHGFSISLNTQEDAELKIVDVLGKLVIKKSFNGLVYIDNIKERGVYLLIIKTSTNSITKKLIVE